MYQIMSAGGRLTRDPIIRPAGQTKACNFTIAVDSGFGDRKKTDFFNCVAWGKQGEAIAQYVKKGDVLHVIGKWKSRKHEEKEYWDLVVDEFSFGQKASANGGGQSNQNNQSNPYGSTAPSNFQSTQNLTPQGQDLYAGVGTISDDDLPF